MRILGKITFFGTKTSLDLLASSAPFTNSVFEQVGALRKVPDLDSWCYGTPWYRFRFEQLDEDVRRFLLAHETLLGTSIFRDAEIKYSIFTLSPITQNPDEAFSCFFDTKTLEKLLVLGLALEIAPASVMPDAPYWGG